MGARAYPDATPTDPRYPFTTPNRTPPAPLGAPTLGFQDFPSRDWANGNQSWLAELGLVAIAKNADDQGKREVRVVGTLLWGFNFFGLPVMPPNEPGIGNVGDNAPALWGAPTQSYLDTLNNFYDGFGGGGGVHNNGAQVPSDLYNFTFNTNVFIPTPAGIMLFAVVAVV